MKFLFDYFPIACFFIAFKLWGIYVATAIAMLASALQVGVYWLRNRRFEAFHVASLCLILPFGALTLIFHNPMFIKWKLSILYWVFGILLVGSQFIGSHPLMKRLLQNKIQLPQKVWSYLNYSWATFFFTMGILNVILIYTLNTTMWVYFKLFGTLILTLLFIVAQATYIAMAMKTMEKKRIHHKPT